MASSLAALRPSTLTHESLKFSELQAIRISLSFVKQGFSLIHAVILLPGCGFIE